RAPPRHPLFPYTTLFRSGHELVRLALLVGDLDLRALAEGLEPGEHVRPGLAVHVGDDDGGTVLPRSRPFGVPARTPELRGFHAAVLGEAPPVDLGVRSDGLDPDAYRVGHLARLGGAEAGGDGGGIFRYQAGLSLLQSAVPATGGGEDQSGDYSGEVTHQGLLTRKGPDRPPRTVRPRGGLLGEAAETGVHADGDAGVADDDHPRGGAGLRHSRLRLGLLGRLLRGLHGRVLGRSRVRGRLVSRRGGRGRGRARLRRLDLQPPPVHTHQLHARPRLGLHPVHARTDVVLAGAHRPVVAGRGAHLVGDAPVGGDDQLAL